MLRLKSELAREAKIRGLTLLPQTLAEFYDLPISYVIDDNDDLLVLLHLPAVDPAKTFTAYYHTFVPSGPNVIKLFSKHQDFTISYRFINFLQL
jgi:hypothetical protein